MKKIITDELVEKLLNKTEFNEANSHDEEHVRKVVLDHYDSEITDDWNVNCEFFIYEETTADGYSVYVCTYDDKNICVSESVHYYDGQLSVELKQAITEGIAIYVDDLENHYIEDAVRELYINLAKLKTQEIEEELINQGYEQDIN